MGNHGDQPEWHITIDQRYEFRAPGQGAFEKAAEIAPQNMGRSWVRDLADGRTAEDWSWRRGGTGEQIVGARLDTLPSDRWAVIHDLTIGSRGANLDHLVIGPPGVFVVNTKYLTGRVTVLGNAILQNGRLTRFVPKAMQEVRRVQERLSAARGQQVHAWSVLAILGAQVTHRDRPQNLTVLSERDIPRWFTSQVHDVIPAGERLRLERLARTPETWLPARGRRRNPSARTSPRPSPPATSSTEPSTGVVVNRWTRYGKDRLYVNTRDGDRLGWLDLQTEELHLESPAHARLVRSAVDDWRRRRRR